MDTKRQTKQHDCEVGLFLIRRRQFENNWKTEVLLFPLPELFKQAGDTAKYF